MSWTYKGALFTKDHIPEGAVGFIYEMATIINGKSVIYIGKKNFYASIKKKISKKNQSTDNRKKKYTRVSKSSYEKYYSSNDTLKKAHKEGVFISRRILIICYSKTELTYQEVKYLFHYDAIRDPSCLNSNILGKFYRNKLNF